MTVLAHQPLAAKLAGVGRDKTTGHYYRIGAEAVALAEFPDLKAEFDRIDALDEADMLREYGFSIQAPNGYLVRMKGGAIRDRYRPTADGDFTHDEASQIVGPDGAVSIVWQPRMHHVEDSGPNYIWPRERIRLTYGHALKMRAYQAVRAGAASTGAAPATPLRTEITLTAGLTEPAPEPAPASPRSRWQRFIEWMG